MEFVEDAEENEMSRRQNVYRMKQRMKTEAKVEDVKGVREEV